MKLLLMALALFFMEWSSAQELKRQMLGSAGGSHLVDSPEGNFFIQQSIGQHSVIGTFTAENNELRQGYIQPLPAIVLGGDPNNLEVLIYPNPFENGIVVTLEQGLEDDIKTELFDVGGQLIRSAEYEADSRLEIPLLGLSQGAYFLRLSSEGRKVVKQLLKQ